MPFVFPTNATSIIMVRHLFRSKYERVYSFASHWSSTILPTQTQLEDWANDFHNDVAGQWADIADIGSVAVGVEVDFRNVEGAQRIAYYQAETPGVLGDAVEDPGLELESLPAYSALIIQKTTDKHGRSKRGRMFIPLISEAIQHDGFIDDLNKTACRQLADIFQTDRTIGGTGTTSARLWDRKENKLEVITRCFPLDVLGTRRDRKLSRRGIRINA